MAKSDRANSGFGVERVRWQTPRWKRRRVEKSNEKEDENKCLHATHARNLKDSSLSSPPPPHHMTEGRAKQLSPS